MTGQKGPSAAAPCFHQGSLAAPAMGRQLRTLLQAPLASLSGKDLEYQDRGQCGDGIAFSH